MNLRKLGVAVSGWLTIALLQPTLAEADWIQRRNGVQIHGEVLRQTEEEITLELARGGVSSFDMRLVRHVHRLEPERRKKLPLREEEAGKKDALPEGIHPKPDAIRSVRRAIPGGTLLLPEDARAQSLPKGASAPKETAPVKKGKPATESAPAKKPTPALKTDSAVPATLAIETAEGLVTEESARRIDAIFQVGHQDVFVRVGQEAAAPRDEAQTERLRESLLAVSRDQLHALELHRIGGLTTWIAERTTGHPSARVRQITGWVRLDTDRVEVIEVEIPEQLFHKNPYRYRIIPRSFRPDDTAPHALRQN